jgi:hypothetical protein
MVASPNGFGFATRLGSAPNCAASPASVAAFGWSPQQAEALAKATNPLHKLVVGVSMALENIVHLLTSAVKNLGKALGWVKNTTQHFEGQETLKLPTGQSPLQHATAIGSMLAGHSLASQLADSTAGAMAFPQLRNALTKLAKGTPEATPNLPASVVTLATDQPALADAAIALLRQVTDGKQPIHTIDLAEHATPEALKQAFVDLSAKLAQHNPNFEPGVVVFKNVGLTAHENTQNYRPLSDMLCTIVSDLDWEYRPRFYQEKGLNLRNQLLVLHLEKQPPAYLNADTLRQLPFQDQVSYRWHRSLTQSPFEKMPIAEGDVLGDQNPIVDAVLPLPLPLPFALPASLGKLNTPA